VTGSEPDIFSFVSQDWPTLCDVYASAVKVELALSGMDRRAFRPMADEEDLGTFLRLNTTLVACIDGRVVGFVAWRDRDEWTNSGYLSWLFVDPAHHRRGIGDRLLSRAMEALGSQAWTLVKQGNDPAIRLYEKHGMRIVKSRPAETWGYPHVELRMALPTSRKYDPDAPNFGR
jgi:ribosomal protein S18 acetylase RimI-like enzyme